MEYEKLKEELALQFALSMENTETMDQRQEIVGNIAEVAVMAACDAWLGSEETINDPPCEALVKEFVVENIRSGNMHESQAIGKAIYAAVNIMSK